MQDILAKMDTAEQSRTREMLQAMQNSAAFASIMDKLSIMERKTLILILRHFGLQSFEYHTLLKVTNYSMSGANLRVALNLLRNKGVIYAVRKTWGDRLFFIPTDLFPRLQQYLMPLQMLPVVTDSLSITVRHEAGRGLELDLFYLLASIAKYGSPLTSKGTIHKKNVQKMLSSVAITVKDLAPLKLQYPNPDVLPSSVAFVLDLALKLDLIRKTPDAYVLQDDALFSWLAQGRSSMQIRLWALWLSNVNGTEIWLQHLMHALGMIQDESWHDIRDLSDWVIKHEFVSISNQIATDSLHEVMMAWFTMLCAFGWMEMGAGPDGHTYFRWKIQMEAVAIEMEEEGLFYVQPDFEIIVPPDVSFFVRWELECCAEHVRTDQIAIYRLTKESYMRAVDHGRHLDDVLELLVQKSRTGLPDPVKITMQQWNMQYGRVYFSEVILLRCVDDQMSQQIRAYMTLLPELQPIGERDYIVPKDKVEELRSKLDKAGVTPRKHLEQLVCGTQGTGYPQFTGRVPSSHAENVNHAQGLVYTQQNVQYYDLDMTFPSDEELFPGLLQTPKMWIQERRTYHTSTSKEIIERAIEWQTNIMLSNKDREIMVMPIQVRMQGDHWLLKGYVEGDGSSELQEISGEHWSQIQLRLPALT
ncbi:helicase-associated domain-containing protein [Paenibacillus selenitireducens]|nr:helicase-associated domain-containing protein [Paenibacillus selenitireducens]